MSKSLLSSQPTSKTSSVASEETDLPASTLSSDAERIRPLHIVVLGLLSGIGPLSTDMYLPALPALSRELGASMSQAQLTLSAGIFGMALGQIIAGPSSDAWGRRRPLWIGLILFVLTSFACSLATSTEVLAVLRLLQGVSGAAAMVMATAIASDLYHGITRARFFSLLVMVSSLAPIVAPVIGSQLLAFTSWRGIFGTLMVLGLLLLVAAFSISETLPASQRQPGDLGTLVRSFARLFKNRRFMGYALSSAFVFASGITYISSAPFILQETFQISEQMTGLIFGANALGIVLVAQLNARLLKRYAARWLLLTGLVQLAVSGVLMLLFGTLDVGLIGILPSMFLLVASLGFVIPNATALALSTTDTAGSAAGLLGLLQFSVGALIAPLVGIGGSYSILPLASAVVAFSLIGLTLLIVLTREGDAQSS
jgi:DHA1 family bicyclomycin/chloramphenicol resistance-like MFS transporter